MIPVPKHIQQLKPYVAGKTIEEVVAQYNPPRISKLASNENRLGCSQKANEAALKALPVIMNYPDPACTLLRQKISEKTGIPAERIMPGSGSEGVMQLIIKTFFEPHEHALTASATFIGFTVLINSRGVGLRQLPLTAGYRFDTAALADAITPDTRMVYIANPNNPTGTYITKTEFEAFMARVPDHVMVIMDEAYYEFAAGLDDYPDATGYDFDNLITLRTFSKAYGLAGYRIGYGLAHPDIIKTLMKVKLPFEPSLPAQYAAMGALEDDDFLRKTQQMVKSGRNRLYRFLTEKEVTFVPSASNSVMMVFETEEQAAHFTEEMLKKGVILRRLPGFGLPNCVRVTVGLDAEMDHFEEAFEAVYESVNQS
ncbi:MAG: histidinol-phosphate transaminase [Candidatus Cyclonatronum sp.]|uniref:histidinol-phosphate transaminase n=1 Tax=Cyclonatronum sp. TaxID=3024185 RepID=UPI0025C197FD|nr:histidinol-phosphate transaminase [Cyclonatronum sp.]MCH8486345.1 histidinol-phosphate transaminase [Cyclonatronum sp.]